MGDHGQEKLIDEVDNKGEREKKEENTVRKKKSKPPKLVGGVEPVRCAYVIPRKNRNCRMLVKKGSIYCGEHVIFDPGNEERIPCPNDPNHTVLKSGLAAHLQTRCNARLPDEPWIVDGLNAVVGETKAFQKIDRRPTQAEINDVLERLNKFNFDGWSPKFSQLESPLISAHLKANPDLGPVHKKHLTQQGSIIGHMLSSNLLKDDPQCSVLELGAGKAQLAYWMAKSAPRARFLLVDRSGARNKYDNKALQEDSALEMKRLRCSIEHLDLSKVEMIQNCSSLTAVQKHFCGSATDAGIRCVYNGVKRGLHLSGFVLVPCCHHKMRYNEYVGLSFLDTHGFCGEEVFSALRHLSSWATCGMEKSRAEESGSHLESKQDEEPTKPEPSVEGEEEVSNQVEVEETEDAEPAAKRRNMDAGGLPWSPSWKEAMGRRAKLLLEIGRAEHLKQLGYQVEIVEYVPSSLSPENILLLGRKIEE